MSDILTDPQLHRWLIEMGLDPMARTSQRLVTRLEAQVTKWDAVVKLSGATIQ